MSSSGIRLLLDRGSKLPLGNVGPPVSSEQGPVYLGSAVMDDARVVQSCKIVVCSDAPKVLINVLEQEVEHDTY